MKNKKIYSKENIKDRMYKNAANFWGINNIENLDPVVKLLIESLASEIYKLSYEINNIEIRVLERIAYLLTPDILMSARPAHMILYAYPVESTGVVNKLTSFYYDDPAFNLKHKIQVSFHPVDSFPIIKGNVKLLICGRGLYQVNPFQNKEIMSRTLMPSEKVSRSIWIGVELDKTIAKVKNLSFYFDFLNVENRNDYLHLLPFTHWEYGGIPLNIQMGIYTEKEFSENETYFPEYDLSAMSDESIKQHYNFQYITITDELKNVSGNKEKAPAEVQDLFSKEVIDQIEESLIWIKVTFPPNFEENILENLSVSINAFPVANKNYCTHSSKTNKTTSIIPLATNTGEYFLSVNSVADSAGRTYTELPFHDTETRKYGTYSVKRGGIERFDIRNAEEYISNLIDLLRDEGAAFSMVGKGFLSGMIDTLKNTISIIEQRLSEINANREIPSYIIIDSEEIELPVYIDYWITNCELANNFKIGSKLKPSNGVFINSNLAFSLTKSVGGRGAPQSNQTLNMYKYILTSRDRIYTTEDVINFCYCEFGDVISLVDVKKGIQVSTRQKEGLIRTIDVFVTLRTNFVIYSTEQEVKDKLINQLMKKSPQDFNYRVFINK